MTNNIVHKKLQKTITHIIINLLLLLLYYYQFH